MGGGRCAATGHSWKCLPRCWTFFRMSRGTAPPGEPQGPALLLAAPELWDFVFLGSQSSSKPGWAWLLWGDSETREKQLWGCAGVLSSVPKSVQAELSSQIPSPRPCWGFSTCRQPWKLLGEELNINASNASWGSLEIFPWCKSFKKKKKRGGGFLKY